MQNNHQVKRSRCAHNIKGEKKKTAAKIKFITQQVEMKEIRNRNALMANHKIHTAQKYLPRGGKIDLMQNK